MSPETWLFIVLFSSSFLGAMFGILGSAIVTALILKKQLSKPKTVQGDG